MSVYREYKSGMIDYSEFIDRVRQEEYDAEHPDLDEEEQSKGDCERCAWSCKGKCYCDSGCEFQDIDKEEDL